MRSSYSRRFFSLQRFHVMRDENFPDQYEKIRKVGRWEILGSSQGKCKVLGKGGRVPNVCLGEEEQAVVRLLPCLVMMKGGELILDQSFPSVHDGQNRSETTTNGNKESQLAANGILSIEHTQISILSSVVENHIEPAQTPTDQPYSCTQGLIEHSKLPNPKFAALLFHGSILPSHFPTLRYTFLRIHKKAPNSVNPSPILGHFLLSRSIQRTGRVTLQTLMLVSLTLIFGVCLTGSSADIASSWDADLMTALVFWIWGLTAGVWSGHFSFVGISVVGGQ